MEVRFDEKGKYFTDIVSKDALRVVVQTSTHRIEGLLFVRSGSRLKDELNQPEQFVAMSEARLFSPGGEYLYGCRFLALNRDQIVWVIPAEEIEAGQNGEGGQA